MRISSLNGRCTHSSISCKPMCPIACFELPLILNLHVCEITPCGAPLPAQAASMLHSLHAILKGALSEAVEIEVDATAAESAPQLQVRVRVGLSRRPTDTGSPIKSFTRVDSACMISDCFAKMAVQMP